MTNYLETLNMKATEAAGKYCQLYNEGAKSKELKAAKKAANDAVNNFNLELSKWQYAEWAKIGNPVELAIRNRLIPGAIRFQFKEKDDVMGYAVKPADYVASLPMIDVVLGKKVFADKTWFECMEALCDITISYLREPFGDISFDYKVSKAAKKFKFPEGVNPKSDDGVVVALQQVFDKIFFIPNEETGENLIHTTTITDSEGRTRSKQWTVIREKMTGDGGCNKVAVCNTVRFSGYILDAMHGILTNGEFGLVTDDEYFGLDDMKTAHKNSKLLKDTTEPPKAGEVPETHKTTEEKEAAKAETKKTTKKTSKK